MQQPHGQGSHELLPCQRPWREVPRSDHAGPNREGAVRDGPVRDEAARTMRAAQGPCARLISYGASGVKRSTIHVRR